MICPKCNGTAFSGPTKDHVTEEWIARCSSCGNGVVVDSGDPIKPEPVKSASVSYPKSLFNAHNPAAPARVVNNSEDEAMAREAGFTLDAKPIVKK